MNKFTGWLLMGALVAPAAQADFLGFSAGAGRFAGEVGGTLGQDGISVEEQLGFSDAESGFQAFIAFEHPVPVLPNIKVATLSYDNSARGMLTEDFQFGGVLIPAGANTDTLIDYQHNDITLYYELWDTGFDLDLGVTARQIDTTANVVSLAQNELTLILAEASESVDEWVPLIYGAARVDLPLTGLYVAGEVQGIGYDGSSYLDYQAKLGWAFPFPVLDIGVEAGYRSVALDLDEQQVGDLTSDIDISGWFINGAIKF
ncbi:TIGR04219 family outer membrane beta-barrel protein [Ferrimonas gelatinilytica]|uniref:TIGR04219 family outer membrane beta-barrel protein n=1 Tax=Ferrimonas gelatinilytica TaxID=1255257 RepID=A0ABP9S400_9GAMM